MGCCRKSHAMNAARKPFRAGKKAVLVALVYLSAMAIVKSARHRELPSTIPRLITCRVMLGQESTMIQSASGTRAIISKNVNTIGSMRPRTSFATA